MLQRFKNTGSVRVHIQEKVYIGNFYGPVNLGLVRILSKTRSGTQIKVPGIFLCILGIFGYFKYVFFCIQYILVNSWFSFWL